MTDKLTLPQARALWFDRQALHGRSNAKDPVAVTLASSGWLRTLSGADIYIAARARRPGMARAELDGAIAAGALRVMPAARGCIYAVPAAFAADLAAINSEQWHRSTEKELAKVGKKLKLVEDLAVLLLAALTTPMTTDAVRKALPAGSIPSFGEAGKKVGLSSPLPLALRLLELDGRIERTLDGGKLDSDRYLWRKAAWATPVAASPAQRSRGTAGSIERVLGAFLDYAGPVSVANIAAWSGMAQRDVKPVLEKLGAIAIDIEGYGEAWGRPGDVAAAKKAAAPSGIALLAFEDNYLVNHGVAPVTDPRHHGISVDIWGGSKPEPLGEASHILSRTIVVDGLVAGFWEADLRTKRASWHTFDAAPAALGKQITEATDEIVRFLLEDIGHARSFSLDSDEDVQTRADRITELTSGGKVKRIAAKLTRKPAAKKPRTARAASSRRTAPSRSPRRVSRRSRP
jgi:hypothetical protein